MSDDSGQIPQQELEQLRHENARLREALRQFGRIRGLYEGALDKIRRVETSLSEANSILKAMHHCGQTLLRSPDEVAWLQRVCEIVAESTDYELAWIGYPDDEGKNIRLEALAGIEAQPTDNGLFCLLGNIDEACPVARTMLTGKVQVIEDIGKQPDCTPWVEEAIEHGFTSSAFLPLGRGGNHIGVFCLYAKAGDAFERDRLKLLAQLAGEVSFGITFLREKKQREKAEHSLSENEQRLRLAFAAAKQAWFDLDVRSGEALLSPEYAPLFGYGPEEPDKSLQHWKGDLHPEDREATLAALEECLATGGPTTLEYRRRTKSGAWKWVLSVGKVIEWDGEHKPLRLIGIHMDISDRKGMESALLESEEQYRLLFENSGEAILLGRPDGKIYSANPVACRMFDRSEKELIRIGRPGIVDESDQAVRRSIIAREKDGVFRGELNMLRRDGTSFPVALSTMQFADSRGNQRISLIIRDITERKRNEALIQARLRLSQLGGQANYHQLMQETLDIAEDVTGSKIGFFHFVDEDQEIISLQAWSTNTIENMCTAEAAGMNYKLSEAGVWADAIRKKVPVIHNDYPHLEGRKGMPEGHAVVEREVCVPVLRDGKVVAAIGVGNKPGDYLEEDIEVLSQLIGFAWETIEARKADLTIRENEIRYRALFQSVADYALVLEAKDGMDFPVIVDANDAALAKHGYTREEMIGKPISLIDENVKAEDSIEIIRQLMKGDPIHFEMEHTCKDGSKFQVESSSSLVKSEKGRVLFFAVERDITDRKHWEEALKTSLEQVEAARRREGEQARLLEEFYQHTHDCIVLLDRDFNFIRVNQAYADACHRKVEDFPGHNHFELYPSSLIEEFRKVVSTAKPYKSYTRPFVFPDHPEWGETFWDLSLVPISDVDGEVKLLLFTLKDVTERKQAEQEIQRARSELQEAQRIAHLGSWQLDNATGHVTWSDPLFEMLGLNRDESVPDYPESYKLFTAESWERLDAALRRTQESGMPYELELEYVRRDGVHGWMQVRGELQRDAGGAVVGVHGIAMDITRRKKSEQILRQRLDELERFTKAAVRREFRIKELKEQIANLKGMQADDGS